MHKHTRGEWLARKGVGWYVVAPGMRGALLVGGHLDDPAEEEANAHLIAAAPNLLEACVMMDAAFPVVAEDRFRRTWDEQLAIIAIRAAIAKARGFPPVPIPETCENGH